MPRVDTAICIELEQQIGNGIECGLQLAARGQNLGFLTLLLGNIPNHDDKIIHCAIVPADAFDIHIGEDYRAILTDEALVYRVTFSLASHDALTLGITLSDIVRMGYLNPGFFCQLLIGVLEP